MSFDTRRTGTEIQGTERSGHAWPGRTTWPEGLLASCRHDHRPGPPAHHALLHLQGARHYGGAPRAWPWAAIRPTKTSSRCIDIACDECPVDRHPSSRTACRGCIAHRCHERLPERGHHHRRPPGPHRPGQSASTAASCVSVCPYSAIVKSAAPLRARLQSGGDRTWTTRTKRRTSTTTSASPAAPASTSAPSAPLPINRIFWIASA